MIKEIFAWGPPADLDLAGFWGATDWVADAPAAERSTARPWNVHPLWMRDGLRWWSRAEFDALEWARRMAP